MRKIFALVLSVMVICSFTIPVSTAAENSIDYYSFLLNKNFPKDFLDRRTTEQLMDLYNEVSEGDVEFGGTSISYLKESEDGLVNPTGAIPSYDMYFEVSSLNKVGKDSRGNYLVEKYVHVYNKWASNKPSIRKVDAVTVNWDTARYTYKGEFKHTDYSSPGTVYSGVTSPSKNTQGGVGWYNYLSSNGTSIIGDTKFTLVPAGNRMYFAGSNDATVRTSINAHYVHDKNPLPVGLSFSYNGFGVSIDSRSLTDETTASELGYWKY